MPRVFELSHTHDICSDEDTDTKALVSAWVRALPKEFQHITSQLEGWLEDYFYRALDWVTKAAEFVVDTTLVGVAMNGLSHLVGVSSKAEFVCALSRGLGANLTQEMREKFAKDLFQWAHEVHPDPKRPLNTACDPKTGRLYSYQLQV
jgi:dynein heavy chain 2